MATKKKFWRTSNLRLLLILELAVMLPALALIAVNFYHLRSIERDKAIEAAIHRDFQYMLGISEMKFDWYANQMADATIKDFPSVDDPDMVKDAKLDAVLAKYPAATRVFLYDPDKGLILRGQPGQMRDPWFREETMGSMHAFSGWFGLEGKMLCETMRKKERPMMWYSEFVKRAGAEQFMTTVFFIPENVPKGETVIGGVTYDPMYLKNEFFPQILKELIGEKLKKLKDQRGIQLAMSVFPSPDEGKNPDKILTASAGWREARPEVIRKLDEPFRGLSLGIQFQGVTVEELGRHWVQRSFMILGVLSVLLIGGLALTYKAVSKEMAVAKLKSDFVSNVSHELRTPLALIRLYAETLELGRVQTAEKTGEYYRIIRTESERLTALINNILDFSRIEAGRKEYEFRETDICELVHNTLESYRDQIQQQGFDFEEQIEKDIPKVRVDREAIARSVVNLVNNALKYSAQDKFIAVKLYRTNGSVKLEVSDRGIGIARNEQTKIFEKFYRAGDPLVHNTKGSGLGLSLVRHIAEAHGGNIDVESTLGMGSKFTLWLPINGAPAAASQAAASGVNQ
jgi:signal transduction histidine kinase